MSLEDLRLWMNGQEITIQKSPLMECNILAPRKENLPQLTLGNKQVTNIEKLYHENEGPRKVSSHSVHVKNEDK